MPPAAGNTTVGQAQAPSAQPLAETTPGGQEKLPSMNKALVKLWRNLPPDQIKAAVSNMVELSAQLKGMKLDNSLMLDLMDNFGMLETAASKHGLLNDSTGLRDKFFAARLSIQLTPEVVQKAVDEFNRVAKSPEQTPI